MTRILLASAALLAFIGAANAADLPPRYSPPPPMAPVAVPPSWTGFYLGGAFGYGLWDMNSSVIIPAGSVGTTNNGGRGWVGQGLAGYDYQFAVANFNLVAGVFGDYSFGDMLGTSNFQAATGAGFNTLTGVEKERSYWDVGGRIGLLVTPDILSYWNAGYTQARFDGMTLAPLLAPMSTAANTYHGWFTGGGVETKVSSIPGKLARCSRFFFSVLPGGGTDTSFLIWAAHERK